MPVYDLPGGFSGTHCSLHGGDCILDIAGSGDLLGDAMIQTVGRSAPATQPVDKEFPRVSVRQHVVGEPATNHLVTRGVSRIACDAINPNHRPKDGSDARRVPWSPEALAWLAKSVAGSQKVDFHRRSSG